MGQKKKNLNPFLLINVEKLLMKEWNSYVCKIFNTYYKHYHILRNDNLKIKRKFVINSKKKKKLNYN